MALVAAFPVGVRQVDEAAAINKDPAGEEVDRIVESVFGDLDKFRMFCTPPGEVAVPVDIDEFPTALEPNRAQAFFHLH